MGTLTVEMKSGYGLDLDNEVKLLEAAKKLRLKYKNFIEIVPTFLGAHAFPPEFKDNQKEYVNLLLKEMIPQIRKKRLAEFCDVFAEKGYFDVKQTEKIIKKALARKLKVRIHADEF